MKNSSRSCRGRHVVAARNAHGLDAGARRIGSGIDVDAVADQAHVEGRNALGERRRRGARLRQVLVSVPRADDAVVDDAPFAQGTVLVLTDVRQGGEPPLVAKHRDTFAGEAGDDCAALRDVVDVAHVHESGALDCRGIRRAIAPRFSRARDRVQTEDQQRARGEQERGARAVSPPPQRRRARAAR